MLHFDRSIFIYIYIYDHSQASGKAVQYSVLSYSNVKIIYNSQQLPHSQLRIYITRFVIKPSFYSRESYTQTSTQLAPKAFGLENNTVSFVSEGYKVFPYAFLSFIAAIMATRKLRLRLTYNDVTSNSQ